MLNHCEVYALNHGLRFNAAKTQLMCFGRAKSSQRTDHFVLCGTRLPFVDSVVHIGHTLRYDLSDSDDFICRTRDMIKKANCMLHTFSAADAATKSRLLQAFCLSLHGSALWNLSCRELKCLEVAFNKVLRRIWGLPPHSHTAIVHCTARLESIFNIVHHHSTSLLVAAKSSLSEVVRRVFSDSSKLSYTSSGFNAMFGFCFLKSYANQNFFSANFIRSIRLSHRTDSEALIASVSCA